MGYPLKFTWRFAMNTLFSPCELGPLSLKNRVVFLPFFTSYADEKGMVTDTQIRHYKRMAASDVGLVVVEAAALRHTAGPHGIHAFSSEHLHGLEQIVEAIHSEGAKAVLQIFHPGRFSFAPGGMAPSSLPAFGKPELAPRAMTKEDMEQVSHDFAESAEIAKKAGFDGVELHGGTGYLLASFLSPRTNLREDKYGGNTENRVRFPLEVGAAARATVGDFPIGYRFMAREYLDDGLDLEEGVKAAELLVKGLNPAYLSVTAGSHECFSLPASQKKKSPEGFMLKEAEAVKKALPDVAVIAAGQLQTREICEKALQEGMTDAIGLGRILFADENWLRKVKGEINESIRTCVQCNNCMRRVSSGKTVFCSLWSKEQKAKNLDGLPEERLA